MNYELKNGYYSYFKSLKEMGDGAKLYDSHNTISIVKGDKVLTYWKEGKDNQKVKEETLKLAAQFAKESGKPEEFASERMTPGRLIRGFLKHIIKLKIEGKAKIYGDRYYYLAKQRQQLLQEDDIDEVFSLDEVYGFTSLPMRENVSHWHYLYLAANPVGYAIELDLTAAYLTSLLQEKTLFWYDPGKGRGNCFWLPDGGAMVRLREWSSELPKWFRLQMLGIMGSHQRNYSVFQSGRIVAQSHGGGIKYGAAFNATHKAIYRVYQTMAEVAELVKDDLVRSHTDSFTLKTSMSRRQEALFLSSLADKGFKCSYKGIGWAHFWNIDMGILGMGKPKGNLMKLEELRKQDKVFVNPMPIEEYDRWAHWLPPLPEWIKKSGSDIVDFVPCKSVPKRSPELLQGYWRAWVNGKWHVQ